MAIDQSFPLKGFDGFCSVFWRKTIQPPSNQHFIWFQKKIIKCKLEAINKWDNGCEKGRWQWNRHRRHFNWYRHCWHTNHNNRVTLQEKQQLEPFWNQLPYLSKNKFVGDITSVWAILNITQVTNPVSHLKTPRPPSRPNNHFRWELAMPYNYKWQK